MSLPPPLPPPPREARLLGCRRVSTRLVKSAAASTNERTPAAPTPTSAARSVLSAVRSAASAVRSAASAVPPRLYTSSSSQAGISLGMGGIPKRSNRFTSGNSGSSSECRPPSSNHERHCGSAADKAAGGRPSKTSSRDPRWSERAPRQLPSCACVGPGRPIHQQPNRRRHSSSHASCSSKHEKKKDRVDMHGGEKCGVKLRCNLWGGGGEPQPQVRETDLCRGHQLSERASPCGRHACWRDALLLGDAATRGGHHGALIDLPLR